MQTFFDTLAVFNSISLTVLVFKSAIRTARRGHRQGQSVHLPDRLGQIIKNGPDRSLRLRWAASKPLQ